MDIEEENVDIEEENADIKEENADIIGVAVETMFAVTTKMVVKAITSSVSIVHRQTMKTEPTIIITEADIATPKVVKQLTGVLVEIAEEAEVVVATGVFSPTTRRETSRRSEQSLKTSSSSMRCPSQRSSTSRTTRSLSSSRRSGRLSLSKNSLK